MSVVPDFSAFSDIRAVAFWQLSIKRIRYVMLQR